MAMRDLLDGECGGPNAVVKLTSHLARDRSHRQDALRHLGPPSAQRGLVDATDDQVVQEFLREAARPETRGPASFRMSSLLQEMREIERGAARRPVTAPNVALLAAAEPDAEVGRLMDEMVAVQSVGTQYDVNEILCLTETERLGSPPPPPPSPPPEPSPPPQSPVESEGTWIEHMEEAIDSVARGELGPAAGEQRTPCSTCGRLFSRLQNLRQHEAMHDASLQRFKCLQCDKSFAWQQTRDRHMLRKHSDDVLHVECPDCDRKFLPDSLRGHRRRVHEKLRESPCHLCRKSFHTRTELHSHLRTHTNERPFVCCTCGRQFAHLTHLRRHEDVHRRAEEAASDEETALSGVRRTYQSRRPLKIAPRPPPPPGPRDIVKHSLQAARIPMRMTHMVPVRLGQGTKMVPVSAVPGLGARQTVPEVSEMPRRMPAVWSMREMPAVREMPGMPDQLGAQQMVSAMPAVSAVQEMPEQLGARQMVLPGAAPAGEVTVIGPECREIIIVECEV